ELINLFMDFETFGEHQWQDTGIFEFFTEFVHQFLSHSWNSFATPSQVCNSVQPDWKAQPGHRSVRTPLTTIRRLMHGLVTAVTHQPVLGKLPVYNVPEPISWADIDR